MTIYIPLTGPVGVALYGLLAIIGWSLIGAAQSGLVWRFMRNEFGENEKDEKRCLFVFVFGVIWPVGFIVVMVVAFVFFVLWLIDTKIYTIPGKIVRYTLLLPARLIFKTITEE